MLCPAFDRTLSTDKKLHASLSSCCHGSCPPFDCGPVVVVPIVLLGVQQWTLIFPVTFEELHFTLARTGIPTLAPLSDELLWLEH